MKYTVHQAMVIVSALLAILCHFAHGLSSIQTWELEDYNDWNLPFAKTVEIKGRKGQAGYTGDHGHTLGASSYKMEVDPSALFTVLFLEKSVF